MVRQSQIKRADVFSNRDLINCFIGSITKRGNKQKSIRFFNYLRYAIARTYEVDGLRFLKVLLDNARPKIFLSSKKIAGVVHKIPTPITVRKSYSMVIHWLILSASKRTSSGGGFGQALFVEINDLYRNPNSILVKKRDEFHKLAYLNKPFLRYYKFLAMVSFFHFKRQGRNNTGRITVRHRGSGSRFFSPNFSYFKPTFKNFKLKTFSFPRSDTDLRVTPLFGNTSHNLYNLYFSKSNSAAPKYLFEFTIGQLLFDVELAPSRGPTFCRSTGSYCQLLRKRGTYATLKFPSGEIRRLSVFCSARLWSPMQNSISSTFSINKRRAGFNRFLGIRPHVRGCAMNPVDHPHGGRTGDSRPSVSPWAQLTKGYRTRFRQVNKKFILMSVQAIKDRRRLSAR